MISDQPTSSFFSPFFFIRRCSQNYVTFEFDFVSLEKFHDDDFDSRHGFHVNCTSSPKLGAKNSAASVSFPGGLVVSMRINSLRRPATSSLVSFSSLEGLTIV